MKRIKRILCVIVILLSILFLSACKKDYSSITYKRFVEKMADELNYSVTDHTLSYENIYQRYYTAIKGDVTISFYEFESEEDAKKFMKKQYKDQKYYSYKDYDDYSTVKCNKDYFLRMIQVDNIVISGSTWEKGSRSSVKKALNELGY